MALNAACVFELRTTGAATNGGGYKTGASGTDFSQQDAAQYALTGGTTIGADAVFLHASAAADMVGNVCKISGTNFTTGWYEIISVVAGVSMTMDRACASAAGALGVCNVGGAVSTFQDAMFETLEPGNKVWVKAGTYTSSSMNVAKDGTTTAPITVEGYNSSRGDNPTGTNRPYLNWSSGDLCILGDNYWIFKHLRVDTNSANGLRADNSCIFINCKAAGTVAGIVTGANNSGIFIGCEISVSSNSGTAILANGGGLLKIIGCYIYKSGSPTDTVGIDVSSATVSFLLNNIISGFATGVLCSPSSVSTAMSGNTFYGASSPSGIGVNFNGTTNILFTNNIVYGLATGVTNSTLDGASLFDYNDFYNNTTNRTNCPTGTSDLALDPSFTNAGTGDFSVGTALKATGFPGVFPGGASTGYLDVGAVQRQEAASGGSGWFGGE